MEGSEDLTPHSMGDGIAASMMPEEPKCNGFPLFEQMFAPPTPLECGRYSDPAVALDPYFLPKGLGADFIPNGFREAFQARCLGFGAFDPR